MAAFVGIMAALQIIGGVLVYFVANSAIHEILAAIMFGMGILAFGLGVLIERADKQLAIFEKLGKTRA